MKKKNFLKIMLSCVIVLNLIASNILISNAATDYLKQFNKLVGSKYKGDYLLTREDFCVAVAKIFLKDIGTSEKLPFKDSNKITKKNRKYISELYSRGIINTTKKNGNLYMYPKAKITRQEELTILGKTLSKASGNNMMFTDEASIQTNSYSYIVWFVENGLFSINKDGSFGSSKRVSTKKAARLIIKTMNYLKAEESNIETIFGTGSRGQMDGDNQNARFTLPYSVLFDNKGKIIVLDTYNNAIRGINDDKVETLTGGTEYIDDNGFSKGYYIDDTLDKALLNRPAGGAYNSKGELLFADSANSVIRYIKDNNVYTFCGTKEGFKDGIFSEAQFNNPMAIAIDKNNNIYVADTLNNCIRKIDTNKNVTTVAGIADKEGYKDGNVSEALFRAPAGIAVNDDGSVIYISDTGNHMIRKIENNKVTTVAGIIEQTDDGYPLGGFKNGTVKEAVFNLPRGIVISDGVLIVADSGNNMVRVITDSGNVVTIAGNGEPGDLEGSCLDSVLSNPCGISLYKGQLYIADTGNNKIKKMKFALELYK